MSSTPLPQTDKVSWICSDLSSSCKLDQTEENVIYCFVCFYWLVWPVSVMDAALILGSVEANICALDPCPSWLQKSDDVYHYDSLHFLSVTQKSSNPSLGIKNSLQKIDVDNCLSGQGDLSVSLTRSPTPGLLDAFPSSFRLGYGTEMDLDFHKLYKT